MAYQNLYSMVIYKFRRIVGKRNLSDQLKGLSSVIKRLDIAWMSCGSLHA